MADKNMKHLFSNVNQNINLLCVNIEDLDHYREQGYKCFITKAPDISIFDKLTPKEKRCLKLYMQAKSVNNIAEMLEITERRVHLMLYGIREKLSCQTDVELISIVKVNNGFNVLK